MIKKITIINLGFLFLLCQCILAQNIHYAPYQRNVGCQHSYLGTATIVVTNYGNYGGVQRTPYTYVWSNGTTCTTPYCDTSSTITDLEVGTYTVTITDAQDADFASYVFTIVEDVCHMAPALVFTPNGDGINDTWYINNAYLFPNSEILIYNRLGQKVYDHKGVYDNQWDAKDILGVPLPDAAYYYVIYEDRTDKSSIVKGCVSIVR